MNTDFPQHAFDDLSQITQTVDFAYDEVSRNVFGEQQQDDSTEAVTKQGLYDER